MNVFYLFLIFPFCRSESETGNSQTASSWLHVSSWSDVISINMQITGSLRTIHTVAFHFKYDMKMFINAVSLSFARMLSAHCNIPSVKPLSPSEEAWFYIDITGTHHFYFQGCGRGILFFYHSLPCRFRFHFKSQDAFLYALYP